MAVATYWYYKKVHCNCIVPSLSNFTFKVNPQADNVGAVFKSQTGSLVYYFKFRLTKSANINQMTGENLENIQSKIKNDVTFFQ